MKTFLLYWNPHFSSYKLERFLRDFSFPEGKDVLTMFDEWDRSPDGFNWSVAEHEKAHAGDRFVFVKTDYKLQRISLDDILFIEGLKDYVRFYLKNGDRVMSLMSMKKLEEYLPKPEFLRTHRSYIVHMTETPLVDRFRIVFDETYIPVSENYKEEVQTYFDVHTLV